jgi:hypothetical protein
MEKQDDHDAAVLEARKASQPQKSKMRYKK